MKNINVVLLLVVSVLFSCACTQKSISQKENDGVIYWIGSSKQPCQGVALMECMMVKKGAGFEKLEWTYFYSSIDGFEYAPGFIYKLRVKEEQIPLDKVPADASSIKYTLLEIVEKTEDVMSKSNSRLHDIWVLEKLENVAISKSNINNRQAQIEINLTKHTFFGNDGCNKITGGITLVNSNKIEFGMIAGTKMACPNMQFSYAFTQALGNTKTYKIKALKLLFFDDDGKQLLVFKKVD